MENFTNEEQHNRAANNQLRIKMNDRYRRLKKVLIDCERKLKANDR